MALAPLGSPDAERATVPLKPPLAVTVTVVELLPNRDTTRLEALKHESRSRAQRRELPSPRPWVFLLGSAYWWCPVGVGVLVGVFVGVDVLVGVPGAGVLVAVDVGVLVGVDVGVLVGVNVGVDVGVLVGPIEPVQPGNLKEAMRVLQLNVPVAFRYSLVYQKVQSSTGSTVMAL